MTNGKGSKFKLVNNLFNLFWLLGLVSSVIFVVYISNISPKIFNRYISTMFSTIPYIGNILLAYLKSLNILNISVFIHNVFKPVITFDAAYFALVFIVFQTAIFFLKRYTIKHDTSLLTVFITMIIIISLWLRAHNFLYITQNVSASIPNSFSNGLRWYLLIELVLFSLIIYSLYRDGKFVITKETLKDQADNFIKTGVKVSAVLVIVLSLFFFTGQKIIDSLKEDLHISYTIDFTPNQDGYIVLKVPEKISKPLSYLGVSVPEAIDENTIISQLGMKELDVGQMVNSTIDQSIDSLSYDIIERRFSQTLLGILIVLVLYGMKYVEKQTHSIIVVHLIEWLLLLVFIFKVAQPLGLVLTIFSSLAFLGSSIHLGALLNDNQELLKHMVRLVKR